MSKPRREYDVYLESELSLGIACGELMVPPHAEVFKVREVIEGDTESDDEIERLRGLLKECQPYVEAGLSACDTQLCDAIEKEVGDE